MYEQYCQNYCQKVLLFSSYYIKYFFDQFGSYNADDTLRDQGSALQIQLELASELESNRQDTVDWGRKWLVDFNTAKTQLVLFDQSNSTGGIDVKMNGSLLDENSSFEMLGLTFF